jgi:hypothetical protein
MLHRNMIFTLRSSPAGGGSGIGCANPPSIANPILNISHTAPAATSSATNDAFVSSHATTTNASSRMPDVREMDGRFTPVRLPVSPERT